MEKIDELTHKIDVQGIKNKKLMVMMKNYDVPTVDVYIELKMSLERIERREDQLLRKQRLNFLIAENQRSKRSKKEKNPSSKLTRKPTQNTTLPGKLFHGKTFNIVYNPDLVRSK